MTVRFESATIDLVFPKIICWFLKYLFVPMAKIQELQIRNRIGWPNGL